jgi:alpha-galactosidase
MRVELTGTEQRADAPVDIEVDAHDPSRIRWSVVNPGDAPLSVRAVALTFAIDTTDVRVFRNGYQSWSGCDSARLRVDDDPSRAAGSLSFVRAMHHADPGVAAPGELRSEMVTVLRDDRGDAALIGFLAGHDHDGTVRVRVDGSALAEAFLGGAVLAPGERRPLHDVVVRAADDAVPDGDDGDVALLARWAGDVGTTEEARGTSSARTIGWCSWYHYFHGVTETDIRANLERAEADGWPFDVFQVDDGYQAAIGDWLATNDRFPSGVEALARDITRTGRAPGIWLAPFLAHPASEVAVAHPHWIARFTDGERPLVGGLNDEWGGAVHALDTTNPDVLAHLEAVARRLAEQGWRYLKLDFTYAPSLDGVWADATRTPAQRVRAGFDAIRRGAGDDVFILGCGAPLGATVGAVDGMRIGPDVAPWWDPRPDQWGPPGYEDTVPAVAHALRNTRARQFMHRRLWLNDPDCVMLRTSDTQLTADEVRTWAHAVGDSDGMVLVSDDLALLGPDARALLTDLLARDQSAMYSTSLTRQPAASDSTRIIAIDPPS